MEGEESVKIFDLAIKSKDINLMSVEELVPLSFIGAAAVSFYQTKVKAMRLLKMAEAQQKATSADGRDAAEMLHAIDVKIGQLLPSPEETKKSGAGGSPHRTLPDDFGDTNNQRRNKAKMHRALASKEGEKAWKEVKKQAEKNNDIPSRTAVLQHIRIQHLEKAINQPKNRDLKDISEVALAIVRELADAVSKLPSVWKERAALPEHLRESIVDAVTQLSAIVKER